MTGFLLGHATHPDWHLAAELVLAQIEGQANAAGRPMARSTLGLVYATPALAPFYSEIATHLRIRTGVVDWVGTVGLAIAATGVTYTDEPALVVMLCHFPTGSVRVFSGQHRLPGNGDPFHRNAAAALVHADPGTPDLVELIADLWDQTGSGHLFGGIGSGVERPPQQANQTVFGGVTGALFSSEVAFLSRLSQGCTALGPPHIIAQCDTHYLKRLDDQPALDAMLEDLGVAPEQRATQDGRALLRALPGRRIRHGLLVGLAPQASDPPSGRGFGDWAVRAVLGIDPVERVVAIADTPAPGDRLVFCTRDHDSAHQDLIRICTELRDEIETRDLTIRGGLYVSCTARGAHLFGDAGSEIRLIANQLGDFPLAGFFANGEFMGARVYGHTGVLTLFV